MDTSATPVGLQRASVSLATLSPGARGCVAGVGSGNAPLSALERRLLELGFVPGEHIEILTEARPGRDPFIVRVGHTTLALRRREAQHVFVELQRSEKRAGARDSVELQPAAARP
jgi:ferrous iron transport protein A